MSVQPLTPANIRLLVDPLNAPFVKQFLKYDVEGDVTDIYYVNAAAPSGQLCIQQHFVYATVSGNKNVQKIAWNNAFWGGSAWDI